MIQTINTKAFNQINQIVFKQPMYANRLHINTYWELGRYLSLLLARKVLESPEDVFYLLDLIPESLARHLNKKKLQRLLKLIELWPKSSLLHATLSWTHYCQLMKLEDKKERAFYTEQAAIHHWSCKVLQRQIKSDLYHRISRVEQIFRDQYILEYIQIDPQWTEQMLEKKLLTKIENTLLELGAGYTFVARQKRIVAPSRKPYFIDLVFYNAHLKAYVLVDLKKEALSHRDLGQMDMYMRLFDQFIKHKEAEKSYGLILCKKVDPSLQEYSLLADSTHLKVATYSFKLPD
ncbi:MAG: PDDEXK nuclease domain-containing protein [Bacteroidota bacterium]